MRYILKNLMSASVAAIRCSVVSTTVLAEIRQHLEPSNQPVFPGEVFSERVKYDKSIRLADYYLSDFYRTNIPIAGRIQIVIRSLNEKNELSLRIRRKTLGEGLVTMSYFDGMYFVLLGVRGQHLELMQVGLRRDAVTIEGNDVRFSAPRAFAPNDETYFVQRGARILNPEALGQCVTCGAGTSQQCSFCKQPYCSLECVTCDHN